MVLTTSLVGCTSKWNANKARRKQIYTLFKVQRWNVDVNYILDPLMEWSSSKVHKLSVEHILKSRISPHVETTNQMHDMLKHINMYSSFLAKPTPKTSEVLSEEELDRELSRQGTMKKAQVDKVCYATRTDVSQRAPYMLGLIDDWLSMLQDNMRCFWNPPGVAERFYEEFFMKFLLIYGFKVRALPFNRGRTCHLQLNDRLEELLREKWKRVDDKKFDVTSQPDLFIVKCGPRAADFEDTSQDTQQDLLAVVEVKVPKRIGQWGAVKEKNDSNSEKGLATDNTKKEATKDDTKEVCMENTEEKFEASFGACEDVPADADDEDSDVEDVEELTDPASSVCYHPTPEEKQVMKRYVPQLIGELVCNFHDSTVFKPDIFNCPYRLGVVVIGFMVQFVGMRFSRKDGKVGDKNRNLCPEMVLLDKRLQTDMFFTQPLDILKKEERKTIIDVLCAAELLPAKLY